ncbi:hypothetical protein ACFQ3R_14115 [Mesonia ostreae]|uniref:TonB C-terminal domain-containing protein n=1 Tax=Mesonia ostreae TaxID=861110 RepID=A0ABU2KMA6_9FLAO|nr:hypothetical protein [Mesonia ostreae]MDT0295851.1 hypothetical protein [Mesonia ostreae]
MYKITWVFLLVGLLGCQQLETKKIFSDEIAAEELKHINWNAVESYPSFPECQKCENKTEQKRCFEQQVTSAIYQSLATHQVVLQDSLQEKVIVFMGISAKGEVKIDSLKASQHLYTQLPKFKTWIREAVFSLPKTYPAQKRGIPVSTSFQLPLTIQSE